MRILHLSVYSLLFVIVSVKYVRCLDFIYHNYTEIQEALKNFSSLNHNGIRTRLYSIGNTLKGNELTVLEITAAQNKTGVPNVKLIGGVFGNQQTGTEVLLHFVDYLISSYRKNKIIKYLLDNTNLHILPCLNPDGKAINIEGNAMKIPLYKTFPDPFIKNIIPPQAESEAVMKWMNETFFVLSASFNSIDMTVTYPYHTMKNFVFGAKEKSPTPDDDVFVYLANVYSLNRNKIKELELELNSTCDPRLLHLARGIENGARLRPQDGTMADYNYFKHGCMELSVGVSCEDKDKDYLKYFWQENKNALIQYCLKANQGVYGVVKDSSTNKPIKASFKIKGRDMQFRTNKHGEFWKILLNGSYEIEVTAQGYHNNVITFEIEPLSSLPKLKHLEIPMLKSSISTTTSRFVVSKDTQTDTADYQKTTITGPITGSVRSHGTPCAYLSDLLFLSFTIFLILK